MKQVVSAGATFVTSDQVAESVLEFARPWPMRTGRRPFHVPAIEGDIVEMLVGPSSQILVEDGGDETGVVGADEFVA